MGKSLSHIKFLRDNNDRQAHKLLHNLAAQRCIIKAYVSMKPAKKIFRLLGGKIKFELALQPSTASTAKIQIQFSRQGV